MDATPTSDGDYWCPLGDDEQDSAPALAPDVRRMLLRFARGEELSPAQKDRLCALGFADIRNGVYVMTTRGEVTARA